MSHHEQEPTAPTKPSPLLKYLVQRVMPAHAYVTGATALDVGSGEGGNSIFLARAGFTVTGIDKDPAAIARSQTRLTELGGRIEKCRFVQADVRELPEFEQPFNIVVVNKMLHHMEKSDQYDVLDSLRQRTALMGRHAISGYVRLNEDTSRPELAKLMEPGELRYIYQSVGWRIHQFPDIPMPVEHRDGHDLSYAKTNMIATPPLNHRPLSA